MAILKDLNVLGISRLNSDTYVNKIYGNGFYHTSTDNTSVLLGGGSYKPLSEFSLSGHTHTWDQITSKPIDGGSQNVGSHDCNAITTNGLWYYSSNGPAQSLGASTNDGALYSQAYSSSWVGQIAQDYRNGKLYVRGRNSGTWTQWLKILDSTITLDDIDDGDDRRIPTTLDEVSDGDERRIPTTLDDIDDGDERKLITSTVTFPDLSEQFKVCTGVDVSRSTNELTTRFEVFPKIFKGTCATAANTTAKEVTCENFTSTDLVKGAIIFVTFTYTNTGAVTNLTMSVNSTTAKPIKKQYNITGPTNLTHASELYANQTYLFQYDGTNWVNMTLDYNNTYSSPYTLTHYANIYTKAILKYQIISFLDTSITNTNNAQSLIPLATYASTNTTGGASDLKTMTTSEFNPFDIILWYSSGTVINAGSSVGANTLYYVYHACDVRFTFNCIVSSGADNSTKFSLTLGKPFYLICDLQSNGKFKLATTGNDLHYDAPWTQDLPTQSYNHYYIFLGTALDTYRITLSVHHPIYYYDNGIKQYHPSSWLNISDKPSTYAPSAHSHNLATGVVDTTYYLMGTTSAISGDLYRYGTSGPYMLGTEVYAGSDINYKDNITSISRDFEDNLFEREDITYNFTWKDSGKSSSGFIAQYIEDLMPEMVEGKEGEKHVKYEAALSKVVGAMFKRIKKLEEKINEQQKEINTLKERIG